MNRSALMLLAARLVSGGSTVVVLALIARSRQPTDLGLIALGLTVGLVLAVIPEAGLTALVIREVARDPTRSGSTLTAILVTRAVTLPVTIAVVWLLLALSRPESARLLIVVAAGPAIQQIGEIARSIFIARDRVTLAGAHAIAENSVWVACIAWAVAGGLDLETVFAIAAFALVVVEVLAFAILRSTLDVHLAAPSRSDYRTLATQAGPFLAFGILIIVASRSDVVILGTVLPGGLPVVGAYYAAARLVAAGEYVPEAISRAMYPDLARRFRSDPGSMADYVRPVARRLMAIGILIPFGVVLEGPWLFGAIYGAAVAPYDWLLVALAGILPLRFMTILFGVALTSMDAQSARTGALALAVWVGVTLELVLIPQVGVIGAVVGVYAVWFLTGVLCLTALSRAIGTVLRPSDLLSPLVFGALGFGAGRSVGSGPASLAMFLGVIGLLYVATSFRTRRRPGSSVLGSG